MRRASVVRIVAAIAALAGLTGLLIQLGLLVRNMGVAAGLWRFIGFFTILANIAAATVAAALAIGGKGALAGARARLMAATSILMVGLVYSVALRSLWAPTGLQKVADVALHDAAPLLWLMLWLIAGHPRLAWREVGWALLPPALYIVYAMSRGAIDGWYAYWFLNPSAQAPAEFLISILFLLCGFGVAAGTLVAADRMLAGKRKPPGEQRVDEAGMASFPASDPPSWTLGDDRNY